jgi:hypothetical protein
MQLEDAVSGRNPCDPVIEAAREIAQRLASGQATGREMLRGLMTAVTGRSDAEGGWTMREAYDALELGQVLFLTRHGAAFERSGDAAALEQLAALARRVPAQTFRSEEQVALQAFSTPLPLA